MIKLDMIRAKSELLDAIWRETGNERAVSLAAKWWKAWIHEVHVVHTFSRDILDLYDGKSKLIEYTHRDMHAEAADFIFKNQMAAIETEVDRDDDGRPHPFHRKDELIVYLLATRTKRGGEGE